MPSRLTSPGVIVAVGGDGGVRHCYHFQKRAYYEYESPRIAMIITVLVRTSSTASGQQSSYDVHLFGKQRKGRER